MKKIADKQRGKMDTDNNLISGIDVKKDRKHEYEECVCCHRKLSISKNEEIEFRPFYIEGAGQLCYDCYHELYKDNKTY